MFQYYKMLLGAVFFLLLSTAQLYAQQTIKGTVKDESGPLPGVTVMVKGQQQSVQTSPNGVYEIKAKKGEILVFTYIGYTRKEVAVGDNPIMNVTLAPETNALNEVVVSALGIKRESKALGYSTTRVEGDKFTQSRDVNLGNALTGKVAGVSVSNNATGASGSSRVVIRGNASMTGNNQPLYVIDGVPFDNTNQGSAGQYGGLDLGDGLSNINPDDIADIQVLKGAAASALYGYRGGNGAILITTKSGKAGEVLSVELNNNFTLNNIIDFRDFQNEYGQGTQGVKPTSATSALNSAVSSWGPRFDGSEAVNLLGNTYTYSPGPDNWKNFYRNGINNQTSVAIAGSSEKVRYRVGLSNLYNNPNIPNSNMKQQGINTNTSYKITDKLELTITANYIFEQVKNRALLANNSTNINASTLYLGNGYDIRWLNPYRNADGNELLPGTNLYFNNPYFLAYEHQNNTDRNRLTGAATLKYDILDWLSIQGQVSRDGYVFQFRKVTPTGTAYANGGELTEYERNFRELNANFLITANKKIGENFSINASLGGNHQDNINRAYGLLGGAAGPFIVPYVYNINNINAPNTKYVPEYERFRVNSFYGTADFGYKDFLFLNFTGRNDWFSTLNPSNNSYFYPSVSTSFVFSEAFDLPEAISFAKFRASYAESSNGTTPYQNLLNFSLRTYDKDGVPLGYVKNENVPNTNLRPVQIREYEAGLNMQFFNNRLSFDAAVYQKDTKDDIAIISTSTASGYNAAIQNIGEVRNRGIEGLISGTPVQNDNFTWNTSLNLAFNDSEIKYLGEGVNALTIQGSEAAYGSGVVVSNVVGMRYGQIMGFAYRRDDQGNIIYGSDGNPLRTDGVVPLGSGVYKTTGGFSNQFKYKNFSLSALFDFKFGAKLYSATNLLLYNAGLHKETLNGREGGVIGAGVTEDGSPNTVAVPAQNYYQNLAINNNIAEEFVYDASFIKLRELSLGYTLPSSFLQKMPFKAATISLVTRNLATLLKHTPNIDPESAYNNSNAQGLEATSNPPVRSFGFNLNVKF